MLDGIKELIIGIKNGTYWYVSIAAFLYIVNTTYLYGVLHLDNGDIEKRDKRLSFAFRLVLASIADLNVSLCYVFIHGTAFIVVLVVIVLTTIILIINADNLPIWEEDN